MIDRRAFLRRLGFGTVAAAAAALTFDVEHLLWVPGEKTILVPAFTPHTFASIDWMTADLVELLKRQLTVCSHFNREYDAPLPPRLAIRLPDRWARGS